MKVYSCSASVDGAGYHVSGTVLQQCSRGEESSAVPQGADAKIQGTGQQAHLGEIGGLTAIGHSTAALSLELERTFWGDINWLNISG